MKPLRDMEKIYLTELCKATNYNVTLMAHIAKIGRATMYRKLDSHGFKRHREGTYLDVSELKKKII